MNRAMRKSIPPTPRVWALKRQKRWRGFIRAAHHHSARRPSADRPNKGAIYTRPTRWWTGACNELVTGKPQPDYQTPEYKYRAVRAEPIADQRAAEQYVIDEYTVENSVLPARESAMGLICLDGGKYQNVLFGLRCLL